MFILFLRKLLTLSIWKIGRFPPPSGTCKVSINGDFQQQSIRNLAYGSYLIQDDKGNIEIETSPPLKLGFFFMA